MIVIDKYVLMDVLEAEGDWNYNRRNKQNYLPKTKSELKKKIKKLDTRVHSLSHEFFDH